MQMVEMKMNMIIDGKPHIIKTLDKNVNNPLINKNTVKFQLQIEAISYF